MTPASLARQGGYARVTRRRPEDSEQEGGIRLLRHLGATVYRLGVRRRKGDHPGTMQTPGLPDVLAFLQDTDGSYTFLAWECKAPGGTLRPEQATFAGLCFGAGIAHVAGPLNDLIRWLVARKYLRADQVPHYRQP